MALYCLYGKPGLLLKMKRLEFPEQQSVIRYSANYKHELLLLYSKCSLDKFILATDKQLMQRNRP